MTVGEGWMVKLFGGDVWGKGTAILQHTSNYFQLKIGEKPGMKKNTKHSSLLQRIKRASRKRPFPVL